MKWTPSRTSVTSLNITVAPAATSISEAYPAEGLPVTPLNASEPPHCIPMQSLERGNSFLTLWLSFLSFSSAISQIFFIILSKPLISWRTITFSGLISASSNSFSTVSFSHPKDTTITSPPKFGWWTKFFNDLIGITASGALIATPQPYAWLIATTSSTLGYFGRISFLIFSTATSSTPDTHWTVVEIPKMFLVPAYFSPGISYPKKVFLGASGKTTSTFLPHSMSSRDGGVGRSSINSFIQEPLGIRSFA